jgi:uncharacterized membrane protein
MILILFIAIGIFIILFIFCIFGATKKADEDIDRMNHDD